MVNQNRKITGTDLCFVLIEIDLRMIWIYSHVCLRYYVFFLFSNLLIDIFQL